MKRKSRAAWLGALQPAPTDPGDVIWQQQLFIDGATWNLLIINRQSSKSIELRILMLWPVAIKRERNIQESRSSGQIWTTRPMSEKDVAWTYLYPPRVTSNTMLESSRSVSLYKFIMGLHIPLSWKGRSKTSLDHDKKKKWPLESLENVPGK